MSLRLLPNLITMIRILLIVPFVWFLQRSEYQSALIIFLIAGLSDGLDGLLAKKFKWQSRFGAIIDPLADKILLFVALLLLAMKGHISWNLFWVATARDIIIVGGATLFHFFVGAYEMRPTLISKWNTVLLILLVLLVLISLSWLAIPAIYLQILEITTITTCVISGLHYLYLARVEYLKIKSPEAAS